MEARNASVSDLTDVDLDHIGKIDFEERWGDPLESQHTELEAIPVSEEDEQSENVVIDFGDGVVMDCSMPFIIKRAMLDPEAKVLPDEQQ